MSALLLAIVMAVGGRVIAVEPGRVMVCGGMVESSIGGQYARCEWMALEARGR